MNAQHRHMLLTGAAILLVQNFLGSTSAFAQASASAYTSAVRYDALGRVVGTLAPDPDGNEALRFAAVRNSYDASGNLVKVETGELSDWQSDTILPANWTGFTILSTVQSTYDAVGHKLSDLTKGSDLAAVSLTQYSYTPAGNVECTAVRMNPATFASPPVSACTLGTAGSNGNDRITRNLYSLGAPGLLHKVQRGVGTALQQDYATYFYNANWKPTSMTDARGMTASMTYDGHDRQIRWNFPDKVYAQAASSTDYEEYAYDANGNRTSLRKRDGSTLTYQFDALGRNTVKVVPERAGLAATHSRDVYYGYDLRGLQTYARFDWAGGEGVTNAFDGFGHLASTTLTMDGAARNLSFLHDLNNNRWRVAHADGNYFDYAFDGLNRMFYGNINSNAAVFHNVFTNRGQRIWQFSGGWTSTAYYGYDAIGRLNVLTQDLAGTTNDVVFNFAYNPANQITTRLTSSDAFVWQGAVNVNRSYAVNGLNQYTSAGPASFTYDSNGNLTGDGSSAYIYDIENRLVSASGATTATLRYDPLGRLYETAGGAAGITRFLYDGDELVAEYGASGNMLRRYVHGSGSDDPIAWFEGASVDTSAAKLIKTDHQGSVVALTEWNGNLAAINSYDEWGIPAASNLGRFQYTGQAWIPELRMYYYKARIYSPTLGRFLQTDPIGYDDQVNLYAYVGNDPVNKVDPDGTTCKMLGKSEFECRVEIKGSGKNGVITDKDREKGQRLAQNYAKTFKAALAGEKGGKSFWVAPMKGSSQKGFSISAKELRQTLQNRTFTYFAGYRPQGFMSTSGNGPFTSTRIFEGATGVSDEWQRVGFMHESIHNSRAEILGAGPLGYYLGASPWNKRHQDPYNEAASAALGD